LKLVKILSFRNIGLNIDIKERIFWN
jgi:hypothetical protein